MASLKSEIEQTSPFLSKEEEALLNLLRTSDCMQRLLQQQVKEWKITLTQYNVLRILRGAHPGGLTCSTIGSRMITAEPDITRLLTRLKALKLIHQQRDKNDRRVVWTNITLPGLKLLAQMDSTMNELPHRLLGHMSRVDLSELIRLLEVARKMKA